jgi:16S rRNA (cytosine1402-N4)-methyltransferase
VPESRHEPVLEKEVLEALEPRKNGLYVDATFGRGGHTGAILARLGPDGLILAMDRDPQAIAAAAARFAGEERVLLRRAAFSDFDRIVRAAGLHGRLDGVLFDLGVSSPQLDEAARGFSFSRQGPLDMRMDPEHGHSAAEWLRHARREDIARVLREYGEERFATRIARAIVEQRRLQPIDTTTALAELVARVVPGREPGKHPATRTFQALRIFVNDELAELDRALPAAVAALAPAGRLAVISFHSLEDRRVKRYFRQCASGDFYPPDIPVPAGRLRPTLRLIGGPQRPAAEEVARNPRSRSAVLRVAEKLAEVA